VSHLFPPILRFLHSLMQAWKFKESINLEINKEGSMPKLSFKNISTKTQDLVLTKIWLKFKTIKIKRVRVELVSWTDSFQSLTDSNWQPINRQLTRQYKLAPANTTLHLFRNISKCRSLIQKVNFLCLSTRRTLWITSSLSQLISTLNSQIQEWVTTIQSLSRRMCQQLRAYFNQLQIGARKRTQEK